MIRAHRLTKLVRQYLHLESLSTTSSCSAIDTPGTVRALSLYTGREANAGQLSLCNPISSLCSPALPSSHTSHHHRGFFNSHPRTSFFSTSTAAAKQGDEGDDSKDNGAFAGLDHRGEGLQGSSAHGGSSLDEDFALGDFDAETEAFAEQAAGDAEFDLVQSMVRNMEGEDNLQEEGGLVESLAGDVEEASSLEDVQSTMQPSEMTKNQVKQYLQQMVDGKFDDDLPPMAPRSTTEQQYSIDMDRYMSEFKMQVVDVNRSNKGTRSGGIGRFSSMVVVGNYQGVLGLGVGKAAELGDSVKKAYAQAMKTLFYVPRFRGHTIIHPLRAKYGRVLLYAHPKSSHGGITANNLMTSICKLAGISNIGIKLHGSRCTRNAVKALFSAFESQNTLAETQKQLGNYRIRELAVGTDRRVRKQRNKIQSAPGEWYRELPQEQKPHGLPEWPGREMGPADTTRLMRMTERKHFQETY